MTQAPEFYFAVEHLRNGELEQKQQMTSRLIAFAVSSFSLFCLYVVSSLALPHVLAEIDASHSVLIMSLAGYVTVGTLLVLMSLKLFSRKQEARWIVKNKAH